MSTRRARAFSDTALSQVSEAEGEDAYDDGHHGASGLLNLRQGFTINFTRSQIFLLDPTL